MKATEEDIMEMRRAFAGAYNFMVFRNEERAKEIQKTCERLVRILEGRLK